MGRKIWKFFRRPNRQDNNFDSNECKFEMIVPIHKVGVIIGKGGKTIKKLQKLSKAKLTFLNEESPQSEALEWKQLIITGNPNAINKAKELVTEILSQGQSKEIPKEKVWSPADEGRLDLLQDSLNISHCERYVSRS